MRQASARHVQQRVLLGTVERHVIVATLAGVHELDVDVVADALDIPVVPGLKRKGRCLPPALFHGPLIATAGGVRVDAVRLAIGDVHVAAIGLPARLACCEMLVGVGDAAVVLFLELVLGRVGIRIAAQPEVLDEGLTLLIVRQALERLHLLVGDDPAHVLIQPLLVGPFNSCLSSFCCLNFSLSLSGRSAGPGPAVRQWWLHPESQSAGRARGKEERGYCQGKSAGEAMLNRIHMVPVGTPNQCSYSMGPRGARTIKSDQKKSPPPTPAGKLAASTDLVSLERTSSAETNRRLGCAAIPRAPDLRELFAAGNRNFLCLYRRLLSEMTRNGSLQMKRKRLLWFGLAAVVVLLVVVGMVVARAHRATPRWLPAKPFGKTSSPR